ncbi:unnamed protein product [Adineta ricciae]|uniref:Reverse transcriptase domain-containing protein n=1 Tax=Adineta ricciae TaxID=249248 RepID=A0A815X6E6_ADIRI|nr:unnamed protein product [Adineta ricciae]
MLGLFKKEGFITAEEYNLAKPAGSRPARLYGLPKIHKSDRPDYPPRPVMSATKTVGYGLGKMLKNRLQELRTSPYMVKNTFDFVNKIKQSKYADKNMVSFDVTSLFTNVPLTYTIDLILDHMYPKCPSICENNSRNKLSMGAPLASVIPDIFMAHLGKSLMDQLQQCGVHEWYRFVDDTFVLLEPATEVADVLKILNNFHPSIKFTYEDEKDDRLSFLNAQVIRPDIDVRFCTKTPPSVQTYFNTKDPVPKHLQADVVYQVNCIHYGHTYIRHTTRQPIRRLLEHGAPKIIFEAPLTNTETITTGPIRSKRNRRHQPYPSLNELRRSERIQQRTNQSDNIQLQVTNPNTNNQYNITTNSKTSIGDHVNQTGHKMDWEGFTILSHEKHQYKLQIKEFLAIKAHDPVLNRTRHSVPLILFPGGILK